MFQKVFNRSSTSAPAIRDGRYVIIDWNISSVAVHEMTLRRGDISIDQSFFQLWPNDADMPSSHIGEWLRLQLQQHQITATDVVVSVPRRHVSLRLLEFPVVDDNELASLIEMHVEAQLDSAAPEQPFDFLPHPINHDTPNRHALLATVPAKTLQHISDVVSAAGLKLKATCVGELAVDALIETRTGEGLTLNLLANRSKVEYIVSHANVPLASHSVPMPVDRPADLAKSMPSVVARMVAGLPNPYRSMSLSQINLLGPFAQSLQSEIIRKRICRVDVINIGNDDAIRSLAVLKSLKQRQSSINFRSRKRPVDVRQQRQRQWIRYGIGAAVLVGLIGLWQHTERRTLEAELATLTEAGKGLEELNERGEATLQEWKFVNNWQSSAVNWSHEIKDFAEHLPEPGKAYLTRLQVEQPAGSRSPVIRIDGIAKDADVAMALNRSLMASDDKYELQPNGIEPALRDSDFKSAFQIEASIRSASDTTGL